MNLFRTKNIADMIKGTTENPLKKTLGSLDLVLLGIGCIIGTGIFVLTGVAAAKYAGPGIMLSFILSGLACGFAALAYAELAAMIPVAGSAYTFAYASLGEFIAFIVGFSAFFFISLYFFRTSFLSFFFLDFSIFSGFSSCL